MFKVGQRIVCINDSDTEGINKNSIYIIEGFSPCSCGESHIILKSVRNSSNITKCTVSDKLHLLTCYWQRRFVPIVDNSAIKDLCNDFKEILETLDVPIKELV